MSKDESIVHTSHVKILEDSKSGEINVYEMKTQRKKEPAFYKTYVDDMGKMNSLSGGECRLLRECLKYMVYNNRLVLSKGIREEICLTCKLKPVTLKKAIEKFLKNDIFVRPPGTRGEYVVNAHLFGKGDYKDLYQIRVMMTYSKEGKLLEVNFDKKPKVENVIKGIKGKEEYIGTRNRISRKEFKFASYCSGQKDRHGHVGSNGATFHVYISIFKGDLPEEICTSNRLQLADGESVIKVLDAKVISVLEDRTTFECEVVDDTNDVRNGLMVELFEPGTYCNKIIE